MTLEQRSEGNECSVLWVSGGRFFQAEGTASIKPQGDVRLVCSRKSKDASATGVSKAERREFEVRELGNTRGRSRMAGR